MEDIIQAARDAGILQIVAIGDKQTELDRAKSAIKLAVRARYIDLPIVSIEVSDEDAQRYIDGATIEELLA
jgi:hypothetical protein